MPEFLAAATVEPDVVSRHGLAQGFLIHIAEHEHLAGIGILNDCRDKSLFVKL